MEADQDIPSTEKESGKAPRPNRGAFSSLSKDRNYMLLGLRIAGDFGATIAFPIVFFVLIGRWLDGKYDTNPWFTILAFILAAAISSLMIYRKAKKYGREYDNLDKQEEEKESR